MCSPVVARDLYSQGEETEVSKAEILEFFTTLTHKILVFEFICQPGYNKS